MKIYSTNGDAMERAKEIILGMVGDIEVGKIYRRPRCDAEGLRRVRR